MTDGKVARGAADWVSDFITEQTTGSDGKTDLTKLRTLAGQNGIDHSKYGDDLGASRIRMTLGNMLRASARKRHGLKDVKGKFEQADDGFRASLKPATHDQDGNKLPKAA